MVKNLAEWSRAVRERDEKCRHCGTDQDLHAHHVLPKHSHPDLRLDLSNGITFCYRCQKREHEKNRPTRLRTERPRKKTLLKRLAEMESQASQVAALKLRIHELSQLVKHLEAKLLAQTLDPLQVKLTPGARPNIVINGRKRRLSLREISWLNIP